MDFKNPNHKTSRWILKHIKQKTWRWIKNTHKTYLYLVDSLKHPKNPFQFPGMDAMGHLFPWWKALPSLKPLLNQKNLDVFFKNDWNSVATQLCDNVIKDSILMYNWYEIYVYTNPRCLLREINNTNHGLNYSLHKHSFQRIQN